MVRLFPGLLPVAATFGLCLFSCSIARPTGTLPVPDDLPQARKSMPPGRTVWHRDVLAGADELRITRGWTTGGLVVLETTKPSLIAIDAATGAEKFGLRLNSPLTQAPQSDGNIMAILTSGRLQIVNAKTGHLKVSQHLYFIPAGPPCCNNDTVYLSAFSGKRLIAFDANTGRQGWYWEGNQIPVGGLSLCINRKGRRVVVVPMDSGEVMAFQANNANAANPKQPNWEMNRLGSGESFVETRDQTVFVATSSCAVYALAGNSGGVLWAYSCGEACFFPPIIAQDVVFVQAGEQFICLDQASGKKLWSFAGYLKVAQVTPTALMATTSDDQLLKINLKSGKLEDSWKSGGMKWLSNPGGDRLLGWTKTGHILAR